MAEDDFGIILVEQTEMNNRVAKEQQKSIVIKLKWKIQILINQKRMRLTTILRQKL